MSRVTVNSICIASALALIVGCATKPSPVSLEPTLTTFSKEQLSSRKIELPANYNTQNFGKLLLGVAFEATGSVDKRTGKPLTIDPGLSARLQTEMAKLKRFTVFSAHNRGGVTFFQQLADVDGQVALKEATEVRAVDLVLSAKIVATKEVQERYNDNLLIYEVDCDFSCEDMKTRTVKFAEKAKGRTARKQVISLTGVQLAGYSEADETQAITQAAIKALALVANKLGNSYPVGGKITGCSLSGDRLTLDKGFEDGIGKNQQCVLFVSDSGVDIPIGLAEAVPSDITSNLCVYKWNLRDKDGQQYVAKFKSDPKAFLNTFKTYAVGYGMPVPSEWDAADSGKANSLDEQMRIR